jgi:hypothetical protein
MTVHGYHEGLPNYDKRQIFHDDCDECERRGADAAVALAHMDSPTFRRALARAIEWQTRAFVQPPCISAAESRVLELIWMVVLQMARAEVATFEGVRV